MDKHQDIARRSPPKRARRTASTVKLSVAGQVIHVPWDDLLVPSRWFAAPQRPDWRD